jgi:hypothetical protein
MICYERGPWEAFVYLRRALVSVGLSRLVSCFHCTALWLSAFVVAIVFKLNWESALAWLAVAGAVSVIERALSPAAPQPIDDEPED